MGSFICQLGSTSRIKREQDLGNIRDKVTGVARQHLFILRGTNSELIQTEMLREGGIKAPPHALSSPNSTRTRLVPPNSLCFPSWSFPAEYEHPEMPSPWRWLKKEKGFKGILCGLGTESTSKAHIWDKTRIWDKYWILSGSKNPTNAIFTQKSHQNNGTRAKTCSGQQNL